MAKEIIEALNKNEEAVKLMNSFKEAAVRQNLTDAEYKATQETIMMMCISITPEAMEIMAKETYTRLRREA